MFVRLLASKACLAAVRDQGDYADHFALVQIVAQIIAHLCLRTVFRTCCAGKAHKAIGIPQHDIVAMYTPQRALGILHQGGQARRHRKAADICLTYQQCKVCRAQYQCACDMEGSEVGTAVAPTKIWTCCESNKLLACNLRHATTDLSNCSIDHKYYQAVAEVDLRQAEGGTEQPSAWRKSTSATKNAESMQLHVQARYKQQSQTPAAVNPLGHTHLCHVVNNSRQCTW